MNDCIHPQIKSDISIIVRDSDIKQTVDIRCAKKSARYALYELKKTHGVDVFFTIGNWWFKKLINILI